MTDLESIFAQKKINKQAATIQLPAQFINRYPSLKPEKTQKLFDRYVNAIVGALVNQAPFISKNQFQVSLETLFNECSTFNVQGKRISVWKEFNALYPFFRIIEKGDNLKGRNTLVEISDGQLKKLLDYSTGDKIVEAMFKGVDTQGQEAEWVDVDLVNLQNYIDNTEYDIAVNSNGKSAAWLDKLNRNYLQARIVHKVAQDFDGRYPQIAKPSVFGRTYYYGLSIQSMTKEVRAAALGKHVQYDLSAAIYGIKLALVNEIARVRMGKTKRFIENDLVGIFTYTKQYLQEKDSIRNRLALHCIKSIPSYMDRRTGVEKPQKAALKIIKDAITAIGFGAETDLSGFYTEQMALVSIIKNPEDRARFLNDPFILHFQQEQDEIQELIIGHLTEQGQFEAIKNQIREGTGRKRVKEEHVLAYAFQQYETQIMDEVAAIVSEEIPVLARIHDAFVVKTKVSDATWVKITEALARHHSLLTLEAEEGGLWQSQAVRKAVDAAKAFEAEHRARIAIERNQAREFVSDIGTNPFVDAPKQEPIAAPVTEAAMWQFVIDGLLAGREVTDDYRFLDLSEVYGFGFEDELERRLVEAQKPQ